MSGKAFSGIVKNGEYIPHTYEEKSLQKHLEKLEGKQVKLSISQEYGAATYPQYKYLFGVVYKMIGDETGEDDVEEVHKEMNLMFYYERVKTWNEETGKEEIGKIPKSITEHDTVQRSEYIEKIRRWASKFLGINIPDPNQAIKEGLLKEEVS